MAAGVPISERPLTMLTRFASAQVGVIVAENAFAAPIRRLQLILQTQDLSPSVRRDPNSAFVGPLDAFKRSARELGYRSFWRGTASSIISAAALQLSSLLLSRPVRDRIDEAVGAEEALEDDPLSWTAFSLYSISSAALTVLTWLPLYPIHLVSVIQAADIASKPIYEDVFAGISTLYANGNVAALFAGANVKLAGMVVDRVLEHICIIVLVKALKLDQLESQPSTFALFVGTQVMTFVSRFATYPFELISRRLQVQAAYGEPIYKDGLDCARKLTDNWKNPLGLWQYFPQVFALDLVYGFSALATIPANRMLTSALGIRTTEGEDDEDRDEYDDDNAGDDENDDD